MRCFPEVFGRSEEGRREEKGMFSVLIKMDVEGEEEVYSFSVCFLFNKEKRRKGGGKKIICRQGKLFLHEHWVLAGKSIEEWLKIKGF